MRSFQQFLLEYDRVKTVASLGQKFLERMKKDHDLLTSTIPETVVEYLEKGDPTPNKQYTQWLIKAYINGSKREDLVSRGHDALAKFETLKKKKLLPPNKTDVGKLKDLGELEDLVDSVELPKEEVKNKGKSEEWLDNSEVRIIVPHNEAAACYYGQGTKWCTAAKHENMFDSYNRKGYLLIFLPKHPKYAGEKYQVHFQGEQLMNEQDKAVIEGFLEQRFPSVDFQKLRSETRHSFEVDYIDKLEKGIIFAVDAYWYIRENNKGRWKEAEPTIMKNYEVAYHYALNVVKGRWKEAEPYILKGDMVFPYALNVVKGRWKEAEPIIMKEPEDAYQYAYHIIKGRWPEAEPIIMKSPEWALRYSREVLKARWPEAEPYIIKEPHWREAYAQCWNLTRHFTKH